MAGWTKADFYASYSICPRDENNRRYTEIRLHYHPAVIKSICKQRVDKILEKYFITNTDRVVLLGAGFGWTGEELINRVGCSCIGIDNSDYIHNNKGRSPDDELLESLQAKELNINEGLGKEIWEKFRQNEPRSNILVMNEPLSNNGSRRRVENALGDTPTKIITEDIWQLLTEQEKQDLTLVFFNWGAQVIHFIEGVVI